MKATPIAQYLDQKARSGPVEWPPARREPAPFKPRPSAAADEESAPVTQVFRRSGLIAAVNSRSGDEGGRPEKPQGEPEPPRRESVFFRSRELSPAPDLEARLAEAYHRGVQEGLDTARAEAATARAMERADAQKRAVVERLDFQMNEYSKVAEMISEGFVEVERRVAAVVARILQPLLSEAISTQIVEELAENMARLRTAGRPVLLRIRGPERLLNALKPRVAAFALDIEYVEDSGLEVCVEAGPTTIGSELAPWTQLIASFVDQS